MSEICDNNFITGASSLIVIGSSWEIAQISIESF